MQHDKERRESTVNIARGEGDHWRRPESFAADSSLATSSVRRLGLAPATTHALERNGQMAIGQIWDLSDIELLANPHLGPAGVAEIRAALMEIDRKGAERAQANQQWQSPASKVPLDGQSKQRAEAIVPPSFLQGQPLSSTRFARTFKWKGDVPHIERGRLASTNLTEQSLREAYFWQVPVDELGLSVRTYRALEGRRVKTLGQLAALSDEQIYETRNLGRVAFEEIRAVLERYPSLVNNADNELGAKDYKALDKEVTSGDEAGPTIKDVGTPLAELGLSARAFNCLMRAGHQYVEEVVGLEDDDLLSIRNFGQKSLIEWREAESRYLAKVPERRSKPVARKPEVSPLPPQLANLRERSWIAALESGRSWEEVETLDQSLRDRQLYSLRPLPENPVVSVSTVQYLLRLGCPLADISAGRLAVLPSYWNHLQRVGLRSALRVFLASREVFADYNRILPLESFIADIEYYAQWLAAQSDWSAEVAGEGPSPVVVFHLQQANAGTLFERFLANLSDKEQRVLTARYNLQDAGFRTLQVVAEELSLTRERIRQIETKAIRKLQGCLPQHAELSALVWLWAQALRRCGFATVPTLLRELSVELPSAESLAAGSLIFLLSEVAGKAEYVEEHEILLSSSLSRTTFVHWLWSTSHALRRAGAPMRFADLVSAIEASTGSEQAPTPELVERYLTAIPQFVNVDDDYWGLARWDKHINDDLVMILRRLGREAHYSELANLLNEHLPASEQKSERNVLAHLQRLTDAFIRTGPGVFDLRERHPGAPERPVRYIDLIEQVLAEAGTPLSVDEVVRQVSAFREVKRSTVVMYLGMNPLFAPTGEGRYCLVSAMPPTGEEDNRRSTVEPVTRDTFQDELARQVAQWLQNQGQQNL